MDRIFLNTKTGQILLSVKGGMMYETSEWKKIGTIDTTLIRKGRNFGGAVKIS